MNVYNAQTIQCNFSIGEELRYGHVQLYLVQVSLNFFCTYEANHKTKKKLFLGLFSKQMRIFILNPFVCHCVCISRFINISISSSLKRIIVFPHLRNIIRTRCKVLSGNWKSPLSMKLYSKPKKPTFPCYYIFYTIFLFQTSISSSFILQKKNIFLKREKNPFVVYIFLQFVLQEGYLTASSR